MTKEEVIESFKCSNEQAKLRLEVEKMRMDSGEIKELEFYIERDEMAIKALEQEPCEDAISRQAVLDILWHTSFRDDYEYKVCKNKIIELPSVEQEPKTGHWIEKDGFDGDVYYDCSECGESWTTIEGTPWDNEWNFCPNCGARMESSDADI